MKRFTIRVNQVGVKLLYVVTCTCGAHSGQLSSEQAQTRVARHRAWHRGQGDGVTRKN